MRCKPTVLSALQLFQGRQFSVEDSQKGGHFGGALRLRLDCVEPAGQPIRNRVPALSFAMRSSTASVQLCDAELSGNNPSSAKAVQWILTLPARWPFHAAGKRVWELRPGYGNLTDAARVDGGEAL